MFQSFSNVFQTGFWEVVGKSLEINMLHSALGEYAQILNWNVTHLCTGPHLLYWSRPLLPANGEEVNDQLCCVLNKILTTFVLFYCLCQKAHELNVQLLWQPSSFFVLKQHGDKKAGWRYFFNSKKRFLACVWSRRKWILACLSGLYSFINSILLRLTFIKHCITGGITGIVDIGSVKILRKNMKYGTIPLAKN